MKLPTVKIKNNTALGYMIINESDFDEIHHKLFKEPQQEIPEESVGEPIGLKARRGRPPRFELNDAETENAT